MYAGARKRERDMQDNFIVNNLDMTTMTQKRPKRGAEEG